MTENPKFPTLQWRVPEVDGVRAFAMLMVVLYHSWQFAGSPEMLLPFSISIGNILNTLPAGVDLFMVLSGFCLFLPLCRSNREDIKFEVGTYFKRRVRRIVPTYYAAIVFALVFPNFLVLLVHLLRKEAEWQELPSAFQILTHLTFTHLFFVETWGGITSAFWSLGLEVQFYLAFPIAVMLYKRFGVQVFWWMIAISVLYRIGLAIGFEVAGYVGNGGFDTYKFLWHTNLFSRWMQFAGGMYAAYVVAEHWKQNKKLTAGTGTAFIFIALGAYLLAAQNFVTNFKFFPTRDFLLSITYVLLLVSVCISETKIRRFFAIRTMTWLGYVSYSIFLIHQPVIYYSGEILKRFVPIQGPLLFVCIVVIGFSATLLITLPFFALFERPFMKGLAKPKPNITVGNPELVEITNLNRS